MTRISQVISLGIGEDMCLIPGLDSISRNFRIVETNFYGLLQTAFNFRKFIGSRNKKIVKKLIFMKA